MEESDLKFVTDADRDIWGDARNALNLYKKPIVNLDKWKGHHRVVILYWLTPWAIEGEGLVPVVPPRDSAWWMTRAASTSPPGFNLSRSKQQQVNSHRQQQKFRNFVANHVHLNKNENHCVFQELEQEFYRILKKRHPGKPKKRKKRKKYWKYC